MNLRKNPSRGGPVVTPERVALYQRIAEASKGGLSLFDQADELGISHGKLKHLRVKASVYGFDVEPVSPENRRGVTYDTFKRDAEEAAKVQRCRCGLALPCHSCIPSIYELASSRRGDAAGMVK